jgi:hypothetical protein
MKDWCRETFGSNNTKESYTWRTGKEWITVDESPVFYGSRIAVSFYFAKQEHANWFMMKWL